MWSEVVPDFGLLRASFQRAGRRRRLAELDAIVKENAAIGNVEELADMCLEEQQFARARELYDRVLASPQVTSVDPYYRRALAALALNDPAAAAARISKRVVASEPKYGFHRAAGLLAHAYGLAGRADLADAKFKAAAEASTLSETYYNYATFLAAQQRPAEAREWAQRILAKKATMPRFARAAGASVVSEGEGVAEETKGVGRSRVWLGPVLQFIQSRTQHRRKSFGDQRAVAAAGVGARDAGDAREFAGNGEARAGQETARDFLERGVAADAAPQLVGKTADTERPDVRERLIDDVGGDDEHRRLQFVERASERRAIVHAGLRAQVRRAHFPFVAQHLEDRARGLAQADAPRPIGARPRSRESTESCAAR